MTSDIAPVDAGTTDWGLENLTTNLHEYACKRAFHAHDDWRAAPVDSRRLRRQPPLFDCRATRSQPRGPRVRGHPLLGSLAQGCPPGRGQAQLSAPQRRGASPSLPRRVPRPSRPPAGDEGTAKLPRPQALPEASRVGRSLPRPGRGRPAPGTGLLLPAAAGEPGPNARTVRF